VEDPTNPSYAFLFPITYPIMIPVINTINARNPPFTFIGIAAAAILSVVECENG
jgi:hypothetical protein